MRSSCLKYMDVRRTWSDASKVCQRLNANLLRLQTLADERALVNCPLIILHGVLISPFLSRHLWIGLRSNGTQSQPTWSGIGRAASKDWCSVSGSPSQTFDTCGAVRWTGLQFDFKDCWDDQPCFNKLTFFCERGRFALFPYLNLVRMSLSSCSISSDYDASSGQYETGP